MKNQKIKKVLKIALEVISVLIFLCVFVAFIFVKTSSGPVFIAGKTTMWVMTDSMSPTIEPKTYILVEKVDSKDVVVGDIVTFQSTDPRIAGQYNTHRVTAIDGNKFTTKGDHNLRDDGEYSAQADKIIGRYVKTLPVMTFLGRTVLSSAGFIVIIVLFIIAVVLCVLPDVKAAVKEKQKQDEQDERKREMDRMVQEEIEKLKASGISEDEIKEQAENPTQQDKKQQE